MPENIKEYDDEIDLLSLIKTIWEGKWKIASIMVVSLLVRNCNQSKETYRCTI